MMTTYIFSFRSFFSRSTNMILVCFLATAAPLIAQLSSSTWQLSTGQFLDRRINRLYRFIPDQNLAYTNFGRANRTRLSSSSMLPEIGFSLHPYLMLRAGVNIVQYIRNDSRYRTISLRPSARYYLHPDAINFHLFAELGMEYFWEQKPNPYHEYRGFGGVGFTRFLASGLSVDGLLKYQRYIGQDEDLRGGNLLFHAQISSFFGQTSVSEQNVAALLRKGTLLLGDSRIQAGVFNPPSTGKGMMISFRPTALYMLNNRIAVGAGLFYDYDRTLVTVINVIGTSFSDERYNRKIQFEVRPRLRIHTVPSGPRLLFAEAGAVWRWSEVNDVQFSNIFPELEVVSELEFYLNLGANVFINQRVALEIGLLCEFHSEPIQLALKMGMQTFLNTEED